MQGLTPQSVKCKGMGTRGRVLAPLHCLALPLTAVSHPRLCRYTAFHGAGFQGRPRVAKVLIEAGLDPQHEHADGYQAIHRACWGSEPRHADVVRVLVEDGGVPHDVKDRHGETPLTHARRRNNPSTVQLLEDYAAAGKQQPGSEL